VVALCESVGFVGLERITAWKVEPGPIQAGMFGNDKDTSKHRVSFFRRLDNQKNPGNEINCEEVWIVQKRGGGNYKLIAQNKRPGR
jgi:hypothetical protein